MPTLLHHHTQNSVFGHSENSPRFGESKCEDDHDDDDDDAREVV